ncbi:hypothetical protein M422DRAFT_23350 [Sphaerobolus stellatus SS14]|nr:hypothetical protein M422DRAFT_23350 [Sphaerobolus stellatus SS14]
MTIPFLYRLFYLYIEPLSALGGAIYAGFLSKNYVNDLVLNTKLAPLYAQDVELPTAVYMTAVQLANLYLLFTLNEHLVLSSTNSIRTWKRLLFGLLVADFGHLLSVAPLGPEVYWRFWEWNAMMWGSVGFVYLGASSRICFLLGVGLDETSAVKKRS